MTIIDLVVRNIESTPNKTALICGDQTISYRELRTRAGRLAAALGDRGVGRGDLVALCGPATIDYVIAVLGTWMAGAAWIPVDPHLPERRARQILSDAGAALVVRTTDTSEVSALVAEGAGRAGVDPPAGHDLAYVIYTSGSTGAPKGVCVEHGPLSLHLTQVAPMWGYTEQDIALSFCSPSFDASVQEIWLALSVGAGLLLRGAAMWTGPQLFERIRQHAVTRVVFPTSYFDTFFGNELSERDVTALSGLRGIYFGGEAASASVVRRWSNGPLGRIPLYNVYGPTEAIIVATTYRVERGWTGEDRVPIGPAVAGHEVLVLDENGVEADEGELYLGGPCLARGYLNRPGLTAARFVRLPGRPGRYYRTGDLVTYQNGQLVFVGRTDRQVKLRGFRIELEEIEAVLRDLDDVRNAVVLMDTGPDARNRLIAHVVPRSGTESTFAATLRAQLTDRLPGYMVPEEIRIAGELPVGLTGKIDRARMLAEVTGHDG